MPKHKRNVSVEFITESVGQTATPSTSPTRHEPSEPVSAPVSTSRINCIDEWGTNGTKYRRVDHSHNPGPEFMEGMRLVLGIASAIVWEANTVQRMTKDVNDEIRRRFPESTVEFRVEYFRPQVTLKQREVTLADVELDL